jgi:lysophospholipase L1-like esterase
VNPDDLTHYARQSGLYAGMGGTKKIVFVGDSRIEWGAWTEMLARGDISNRGIAGDTTSGVLDRLRSSVPTDGVVCVVQVGVNDLSRGLPVATVLAHYQSILTYLLRERRAQVILTSIILVRQDLSELNKRIAECNRRLSELGSSMGAIWLDLNEELAPLAYLAGEYSDDGVHLNAKGYDQICRTLRPLLPAEATN